MQESPSGELILNLDEYRELPPFDKYKGLHRVGSIGNPNSFPNSQTWKGLTEGNLIPIKLINANAYDSSHFFNAIEHVMVIGKIPYRKCRKRSKKSVVQIS